MYSFYSLLWEAVWAKRCWIWPGSWNAHHNLTKRPSNDWIIIIKKISFRIILLISKHKIS